MGLSENKKVYIIYNMYTEKTYISHNIVFFKKEQFRSSQVHIFIFNENKSNNEINITIGNSSELTY